ncbi:uncharacterized protein LAESUDRAFT_653225 [Laetiporus sulphureus 93-53]|uniref:Membrane anchor Opy2 N-terminal domain-containing protein n=1 Tax=Laetiporus sulphureus 93-53 TaxID=1314785 RepID=A0A165E948_9APHY|nr:uncharacterized protein LAESUDRAFT_653225 [Laetiporus sulphureus 93-53]KZT06505.1 hypothetical protein LAESUDRAFT_653225 [Laetiporus sulphureus 93-53]
MVAHSSFAYRNTTESRRSCVTCTSPLAACSCSSSEECVLIDLSCDACPHYECISQQSSSSGSSGISSGALAGAVIACVVFLALVLGAFWFYRRRLRQRRLAGAAVEDKVDAPARAEDVLNRPDPNEKGESEQSTVRFYTGATGGTINLDPESQAGSTTHATDGHSRSESSTENPFGDNHSIQTTSTGTQSNVIPIAFVPPASFTDSHHSGASSGPVRPSRAPDLDLGMEQSRDALAGKSGDGQSQLSGVSGINNRASYLTTGSFGSDFLNEAPVIVTPTRGVVKQHVVGLVKPEMIRTSPQSSPKSGNTHLRAQSGSTRPPVRSPLAAASFGPSDVVAEIPEDDHDAVARSDPFGDEHSLLNRDGSQRSPAPSTSTFGTPDATKLQHSRSTSAQNSNEPDVPSAGNRPLSTYTQAASIVGSVIGAEISSGTRVHLGLDQFSTPATASSGVLNTPRTPYRMTSAKFLNTPPSGNSALEQEQQRAMQDIDQFQGSRMSLASVVSTSTRADSILESFPFVPPSPISNRPIRSPPRSPLAQQSTAGNKFAQVQRSPVREAPSRESAREAPVSPLPPPPRPMNRKALGISMASQSSTASNGLSSFPFQIDTGISEDASSNPAPSSFPGRQRASLDTLALTSDLSSYPLNFERNMPPPPPRP